MIPLFFMMNIGCKTISEYSVSNRCRSNQSDCLPTERRTLFSAAGTLPPVAQCALTRAVSPLSSTLPVTLYNQTQGAACHELHRRSSLGRSPQKLALEGALPAEHATSPTKADNDIDWHVASPAIRVIANTPTTLGHLSRLRSLILICLMTNPPREGHHNHTEHANED